MDPHPSRNRRRFAGTIALVLGFAGINVGTALADGEETITVCSSGCDYASIQAAIDAAPAGAIVEVGAGVYSEALKVDQSLRILGANAEASPNVVGAPAESNKRVES